MESEYLRNIEYDLLLIIAMVYGPDLFNSRERCFHPIGLDVNNPEYLKFS